MPHYMLFQSFYRNVSGSSGKLGSDAMARGREQLTLQVYKVRTWLHLWPFPIFGSHPRSKQLHWRNTIMGFVIANQKFGGDLGKWLSEALLPGPTPAEVTAAIGAVLLCCVHVIAAFGPASLATGPAFISFLLWIEQCLAGAVVDATPPAIKHRRHGQRKDRTNHPNRSAWAGLGGENVGKQDLKIAKTALFTRGNRQRMHNHSFNECETLNTPNTIFARN